METRMACWQTKHSLTHDLKQVVVKGCCCEPCVTLGLMTSRREVSDLRVEVGAYLLGAFCVAKFY